MPKDAPKGRVYVRRDSEGRTANKSARVTYTIKPRYHVIRERGERSDGSWREAANEVLTERAELWEKLAKL